MFPGLIVLLAVLDAVLCTDGSLLLERRSPSMGFMGLRGKKDALEEQLDKRAANSLGFSGMRGKKDSSDELMDPDPDPDPNPNPEELADLQQLYEKRGPSSSLGFNGMRGKKDSISDSEAEEALYKRARNTLGFSGLRGKKLSDAVTEEDEDAGGGYDKRGDRNTLGFSGMRGKKDDALDLQEVKRARNSLGFSGMRGKKSGEEFGEEMKRGGGANALGFSGMRGKKDLQEADLAKRAKSMSGFVGMRGRRDFWEADNEEKRSPIGQGQAFMGMRGRRPDSEEALGYLLSPAATRENIVTYRIKRFLPVNWPLRNSKKAPFSGFIGMRGKKSDFQPASGQLSGSYLGYELNQ